ncbi:MAG TPA: OsmC family protein [Caulobacteraceae bacterium]|nr:OsmC family protein [Caulobacteraceae bacterium]
MPVYRARLAWRLEDGDDFAAGRYTRRHTLEFDGLTVAASASPLHVRAPFSEEAAMDPEEAFVASLSSCHMLWFLYVAREEGFSVESYRDEAEGLMEKNEGGKLAMTKVTLKPYIVFKDNQPSEAEVNHLHHRAHDECYIANSVKTEVVVEPQGRT